MQKWPQSCFRSKLRKSVLMRYNHEQGLSWPSWVITYVSLRCFSSTVQVEIMGVQEVFQDVKSSSCWGHFRCSRSIINCLTNSELEMLQMLSFASPPMGRGSVGLRYSCHIRSFNKNCALKLPSRSFPSFCACHCTSSMFLCCLIEI